MYGILEKKVSKFQHFLLFCFGFLTPKLIRIPIFIKIQWAKLKIWMKIHYHQFPRWLPRGWKRRIVVQTLNFNISDVIWDRSLKFGTYAHLCSMYICSKFHWNLKRWVSGMSHFDMEFPLLKWCHVKCAHGGRGATLNELRRSGYWW